MTLFLGHHGGDGVLNESIYYLVCYCSISLSARAGLELNTQGYSILKSCVRCLGNGKDMFCSQPSDEGKVGLMRFHPTSCECDTVLHLILRPTAKLFQCLLMAETLLVWPGVCA